MKKMMKTKKILALLTIFVLVSCNKNPFLIDVSDVDVDLDIYRLDEQMFTTNADELYYKIPEINKNHKDFFELYNLKIIGVGLPDSREFYNNLSEFYYYCDQVELYETVEELFPTDNSTLEPPLTEAFKHYKYYFPENKIPKIITCISGFNLSVFTGEDFIGISLDKYLGTNYEGYQGMFENYISNRMHRQMLPIDVMRALCIAEFPQNDSISTVLTNAIYQGRTQYFLDAMFPETVDSLKWGFSDMQWRWVEEFEQNIWDFMVSQKIVFSTKIMDIKTYTDEAPFTTPFGNKSAPRAGNYIGYQIVKSYMDKNENISLAELMNERDYMKIYNNSYYNP